MVTNPDAQSGTLANGYAYRPPPSASRFYVLTPCRLFDTRNTPAPTPPRRSSPRTKPGRSTCAAGAAFPTRRPLTVNVTVVGLRGAGELRLFPGNGISPNPPASVLIFYAAGRVRANNGFVRLATDGTATVKVQNVSAAGVHFILDVSGYFLLAP